MFKSRNVTLILLIALFISVGLSQHAQAYIDLGTGSYLLQVFVAAMFGMMFSAKSLWAKVRKTFGGSEDRESRP
jgi:formate hydrogenlyase subunit 4